MSDESGTLRRFVKALKSGPSSSGAGGISALVVLPSSSSHVRFPLLAKLSVMITLTICLTAGVIGFVVLKRQGGLLRQELTARGQTLIQHLAVNASTPLLERDELALNVLVEETAHSFVKES